MAFRVPKLLERRKVAQASSQKVTQASSQVDAATRREAATTTIKEYMAGKNEFQDQMAFLAAIKTLGKVGRKREWEKLMLPFSKDQIGLKIQDIMMTSFDEVTPAFIKAMKTVTSLSKFKPLLTADVKGSILSRVLRLVLTPSRAQPSPEGKALQQEAEAGLGQMLWAFLQEDPSAHNLLDLLGCLIYWTHHGRDSSRQKAVGLVTSLLLFCRHLPALKGCEEPGFGDAVAQLAIHLVDSAKGIREEAKGALTHLCHLLFCRKGLMEKTNLFCLKDPERPWRDGYVHLNCVGKLCQKHLDYKQRRASLKAAVHNILQPGEPWLREGSIFFLSSLLGQGQELLEEQQEKAFRESLCHRIFDLCKNHRQVEEVLNKPAPICYEASPVTAIQIRPLPRKRLPPLPTSRTASVRPPAPPAFSGTFDQCRPVPPVPPTTPVLLTPKPPAGPAAHPLAGAARRRSIKHRVAAGRLPPMSLDVPSSPENLT